MLMNKLMFMPIYMYSLIHMLSYMLMYGFALSIVISINVCHYNVVLNLIYTFE